MLFPAESKSFSSQLSILSLCDRHTRQMLCHGTNTARSLLHKTAGENEELTQSRWSLTPVKIMCVIEFFLLFLLASHSIYSLCWLLPDVLRKGRRRATTTQIYSLNMASWRKRSRVGEAIQFQSPHLPYLLTASSFSLACDAEICCCCGGAPSRLIYPTHKQRDSTRW